MPDYWTVNQENLAEHFDQSFEEEKIGKLLDQKIARTARRQLDGRHLLFGEFYFAVLNNPLSPKLADKQAIEDELNIDGGKYVLACF